MVLFFQRDLNFENIPWRLPHGQDKCQPNQHLNQPVFEVLGQTERERERESTNKNSTFIQDKQCEKKKN